MLLRSAGSRGFIRTNASFRAQVGFSEKELNGQPLLHWIDPVDQPRVRAMLEGGQSCRAHHRTRTGAPLALTIRLADVEQETVVLGRCVGADDTQSTQSDADTNIKGTLDTIARIVEEQNPDYKCSILLVEDGCLTRGAGPSLPEAYNAAVDGCSVGPTVGSCGTAIYWNVPVIVEDIQKDPLWASLAGIAKAAGLAACWSHPFAAKNGRILGALALYASEPRAPKAEEWCCLRAAARITGLAVERGRAEEALRQNKKREWELEQQLEHASKMEALEQQLQQAAKMEALGVLAGGVAHDFNNLLTSIISYAGFVRDELPPGDKRREDIQQVLASADRATGLTRQLLLFARQRPAESHQLDVCASVRAIEPLLRRTIGENIDLSISMPDEPIHVWGAATQLDQIIVNLSVNAKDAMPDGGVLRISVKPVELAEKRQDLAPGKYVFLQVEDRGVGLEAATKSRIFEPFFTTKGATKGTGLGLATCYGVVKQLGGSIQVESEPAKGTIFSVYLPQFQGAKRIQPPSDVKSTDLGGDETILIVEDEPSILQVAKRVLSEGGYTVLTAEDGVAGIEIFRQNASAIDLVFSDVVLPRSSGFDVATEVRRTHPDVAVLLTTGYPDRETKQEASSFPIFWKPYTPSDLLRRVRSCLNKRQAPRRARM